MSGSAQLLDAAKRGSDSEVMAVIAGCERQIVAAIIIAGISRNSPHFEDAQNRSLFEIWRSARSYNGSAAPCTWMSGIARRVTSSRILDPLGRNKKKSERAKRLSRASDQVTPAPDQGVADRDLLTRVLGQLSEEHREVLVFRYLLGYSLDEIADRTGLKAKTVSSRLTRAKRAALTLTDSGMNR